MSFRLIALVILLLLGASAAALYFQKQSGEQQHSIAEQQTESMIEQPTETEEPIEADEPSSDLSSGDYAITEYEQIATLDNDPEEPGEVEPEAEPEPEAPVLPVVSENAKAHICYLSFNNPSEVSVARTFVHSLTHYPEAPKITVTEYQVEGSDPEKSLSNLVKSGVRCDGLVLSGHHDEDGEFWGDRTSGDLEIDFLYELAAKPSNAAWFSQVKAMWLQGCHTATTRIFNPDVDSDERISGSPLTMINRHLNLSEMEDSIDELNDIFLENTEEDNIILDYGRVFPAATIYTWWDKSPGVEAGSHWSFPYHIVQTSYVVDTDPKFFQHPFQRPIPKAAALRYAEILYEGLTRPTWPGKHSGPLHADEDTLIKGWKEHGRWAVHKRRFSFENASAVGHRSLLASDSGILKQLRGLTILLQQLDEEWVADNPAAVVKAILDHEDYIPYNVYLLWAMAQKNSGLKDRMRASKALKLHLDQTINSGGEDGQLKKDYRKFRDYIYS